MLLTTEHKQHLITKAMKDDAFRQALLRDARATIGAELHLALPSDLMIHVLEGRLDNMYQLLPPYPTDWPPGLSVEAMEQRLLQTTGALEETQQTVARGQARLLAKAWHDAAYHQ